jgi:hypothetical protein
MHRPTVGLIALALLAGAAACYLFGWGSVALESAFWRIGLVMVLFWLALPELVRVRSKFLLMLFAAGILLAVLRPKLLPLVVFFCIAYAVLRGRSARPGKH